MYNKVFIINDQEMNQKLFLLKKETEKKTHLIPHLIIRLNCTGDTIETCCARILQQKHGDVAIFLWISR